MELFKMLLKDFMIIMKYYKSGNLNDYITKNFYIIKWNEKLRMLNLIVRELKHIHKQIIIHQDFHSVSILYENEFDIVISDLGISKSSIDNDDDEVYGVISYIEQKFCKEKNILYLQIFIALV